MDMIKFGRFEYAQGFKYDVGFCAKPIFGWVMVDGRVFNCIEVDGKAAKGEIEFGNIDGKVVRESYGMTAVASKYDGPYALNYCDCRKDKNNFKMII